MSETYSSGEGPECPFCGCVNRIDHCDLASQEEDYPHETTCRQCDKEFTFRISWSCSYYSKEGAD